MLFCRECDEDELFCRSIGGGGGGTGGDAGDVARNLADSGRPRLGAGEDDVARRRKLETLLAPGGGGGVGDGERIRECEKLADFCTEETDDLGFVDADVEVAVDNGDSRLGVFIGDSSSMS
jgi:hypothetical protein